MGAKADQRFLAKGVGSRDLLIGTGKDDGSDALDRRVEFKTMACAAPATPEKTAEKPDRPTKAADRAKAKPRREAAKREAATERATRAEIEKYVETGGLGRFLSE